MDSGKRVLVVEDEGLVAADLEEALESLGFEVCGVTASGDEAIILAQELKPDLVLMDIFIEGEKDGIEAASAIRERENIPVVYLTAHADDATLARAKVTEPYGYIIKPFEEVELRTALEIALFKHASEQSRNNNQRGSTEATKLAVEKIRKNFRPSEQGSEILEELREFFSRIIPFKHLDESMLTAVCEVTSKKEFRAGDYIAFEGDDDTPGFVVVSGRVAMYKGSASGKEFIVELMSAGDPFGLLAATDTGTYPVTAKAQIDTTVAVLPRSVVLTIFEQIPESSKELIDMVFKRLRGAHDVSRGLAHDRVELRIAYALLALVPKFGLSASESDGAEIQMTRQELADLIGSTPETVTRTCKLLEADKILAPARAGTIKIVNVAALEDMVE
jgi:CRP-like cAMP-binding protein/AmiR/NasT family two-component response regulator